MTAWTVIQTFGEGAKFHPHVHALDSRGGWTASGEWMPLPYDGRGSGRGALPPQGARPSPPQRVAEPGADRSAPFVEAKRLLRAQPGLRPSPQRARVRGSRPLHDAPPGRAILFIPATRGCSDTGRSLSRRPSASVGGADPPRVRGRPPPLSPLWQRNARDRLHHTACTHRPHPRPPPQARQDPSLPSARAATSRRPREKGRRVSPRPVPSLDAASRCKHHPGTGRGSYPLPIPLWSWRSEAIFPPFDPVQG